MSTSVKALFQLGQVLSTPGALDAMKEAGLHPIVLLRRHQVGDWGVLDEEDKRLNDEAVKNVRIPVMSIADSG